ncbi:MAG: hypothetical protein IH624_15145 [Phycisphaerae bacterium]|nr:hypothetical protein [Phycisphaerae bacterium]
MLAQIEWETVVVDPVREMLARIINYLPVLVGALIVLLVGWVIARAIRWLTNKGLKAVQFDRVAEKAGIPEILRKGDLHISPRGLVAGLVFWLVMLMVLVMFVNALGLPRASDILEAIFAYIPRVIAALLVLVLGMFVANLVSRVVRVAAANADLLHPGIFAGITRWAIIIFAVAIALSQLGIAPVLVTTSLNIVLAGLAFALALAVGLGSKDAVARYLEERQALRYQKTHSH